MTPFANSTYLHPSHRALWMGAALALPMLTPFTASADVACGDTTCTSGFVCETYQSYDCPATTTAPTKDLGGSGGSAVVAPDERIAQTSCTPKPAYSCVPAPCNADTDCGANMVCNAYEISECSGGAVKPTCAPNSTSCEVVEAEPPVCTTNTIKQCAYRYTLPCKVAADCGAGFTCEESISCACSGSRGTATAGQGGSASTGTAVATPGTAVATPMPPDDVDTSGSVASGGSTGVTSNDVAEMPTEPSCSCAPSGVFHCKLQTIACDADSDCPSGLLCTQATHADCAVSSDGSTTCPVSEVPAKTCQTPYYQRGGVDLSDEAASNSGTATGSTPTTPKAGGDHDGPVSPTDATSGDAAAPASDDTAIEPSDVSGSGCSVAAPASQGHWLLLALAAGLAMLRPAIRSRK